MAIITWKWWGNLVRLLFGSFCYEPKRCWLFKRGFLCGSAKNTFLFWFKSDLQALESFTYSFVRQPEMRLYEIVVLVLAFCLVFTKLKARRIRKPWEVKKHSRGTRMSTAPRQKIGLLIWRKTRKKPPNKTQRYQQRKTSRKISENGCLFGRAHSFSLLAFLQTTTSDSFKLASLSVETAMVSVY